MKIPIFNEAGKEVGSLEFDEKILGEKVRTKLLHQAVIHYEANLRVGTVKTKSKAEEARELYPYIRSALEADLRRQLEGKSRASRFRP